MSTINLDTRIEELELELNNKVKELEEAKLEIEKLERLLVKGKKMPKGGNVHRDGGDSLRYSLEKFMSKVEIRIDKNGKERELHVDKALKVANLNSSATPKQPMRVLKYRRGWASELLTRCKYFQVERQLLNTEILRELTDFQTGINSFHVLLCTDGCGVLSGAAESSNNTQNSISSDFVLNFFKGDCIFVPANSIPLKLHGKAQLLNISC